MTLDLTTIDLIFRGGAMGTMMATALVLASRIGGRQAWAVASFGISVACYLLISTPGMATALSAPWRWALIAGASLTPIALVWLTLELLTDKVQRQWPIYGLAALGAVAALAALNWEPARLARGALVLVIYLGVVVLAVRADADDLVASRRVLRRALLGLMGTVGIAISVIELTSLDQNLPGPVFLLQSGGFWALALLFAYGTLTPDAELFPHRVPARPAPTSSTDREKGDLARLTSAIESGIWRREGLSVADLARDVRLPEHRLRNVINQQLGWRNFSTFINHHRIAEAKRQLADPNHSRKTVLEIAYDCGFASLGPFNRAFRDQTGQTPTAWRAEQTTPSDD